MRDLTGAPHQVPGDLPASPCVVLMPFRQTQQRDVDDWARELAGLPMVEIDVLPPIMRMARGWIERGMAGDTDPAVQARVWCVFTPLGRVLTALGADGHRKALAAVVTRDGQVITMARGAPTPGMLAAFRTAMARPR